MYPRSAVVVYCFVRVLCASRLCVRPSGICLVLLLALLIRGGVLWLTPGALLADPDGYRQLAVNLVVHGTLGYETFNAGVMPTAYRPPLYPLLLSACVAPAAVAVLHLVMGVATVGLVLVLGRWWGLGNRGAALAALLVACDPILLSQSTQVMTETPATFLATAGLVVLTWASPLLGWQLHCHPESEGETNIGAAVQLPHQRGGLFVRGWPAPHWPSARSAGPHCCCGRSARASSLYSSRSA